MALDNPVKNGKIKNLYVLVNVDKDGNENLTYRRELGFVMGAMASDKREVLEKFMNEHNESLPHGFHFKIKEFSRR